MVSKQITVSKRIRVVVDDLASGERVLPPGAAHYVKRVLRLRVGTSLVAIDPLAGVEADATLLRLGKEVVLEVGAVRAGTGLGLSQLSLVQGLGKGDKTERVLRDAVALGVGRITLVIAGRSVPTPNAKSSRRQRWQEIAVDVARQCGRSDIPEIEGPLSFEEALAQRDAIVELGCDRPQENRLILQPGAGVPQLTPLVRSMIDTAPRGSLPAFQLWIGPEGGFAESEDAELLARGAHAASLGPFVLRTELAATAALSIVASALWERRAT